MEASPIGANALIPIAVGVRGVRPVERDDGTP